MGRPGSRSCPAGVDDPRLAPCALSIPEERRPALERHDLLTAMVDELDEMRRKPLLVIGVVEED
jgi:hypothetical protein